MSNTWRDPKFAYQPSESHNDVRAFHRRQQERRRAALAQAAEVKAKVAPIKRKVSA